MVAKKKSGKPNISIKKSKDKADVDIKIRNLGKAIKDNKKDSCCSSSHKHCGNCWIFGSALAMVISYERSASILWAILHGAMSWFYVLFRAIQIWGWF